MSRFSLLWLLWAVCLNSLVYAQSFYSVTVVGKNFPRQKLKLVKLHRITEPFDSTEVEGDFVITVSNQQETEPMWYELRFENPRRAIRLMSDRNSTVTIDWQTFNRFDLASPFQVTGSPATSSLYQLNQRTGDYYTKLLRLKNYRDSAKYVSRTQLADSTQRIAVRTANQMLDTLLSIADTATFVATASDPFYALLSVNETYELNRIDAIATVFDRVGNKYRKSTYFRLAYEGLLPRINIAKSPKKDEQKLNRSRLPELRLLTAHGKSSVQLPIQKRYAFIDYWASWCGPCRTEMPVSRKLADELGGVIDFIYIALDDNVDQWKKALSQVGLASYPQSYLLAMPLKQSFVEKLQIQSIPRYMIVDRAGTIIESYARRPSDPLLRSHLLSLTK